MFALSKFRVFINNGVKSFLSHSYSDVCPVKQKMVVTVIDVSSFAGQNLALLLKQDPNIDELRLFSKKDTACGIAMDLSCIDTSTRVRAYTGNKVLRDAILRARIVVLIGGLPEKACTLQKKLFEKNLDEVRKIAMYMAEFNPRAILCIARPPVNFLVPLASEEYIKAEVYDPRKIIGVTTIALMRANTVLAKHFNKSAARVICPVIGGVCPMTSTAVFSQAKPVGNFDEATHDKLTAKIGRVEDSVLKIKEKEKSGPLSLAHALATSRFVNSVVKALNGQKNCVECAFVRQTGHICKFLPYMMSIVVLGKEGIKSCHMPKVNKHEAKRLKCAHTFLMKQIAIGRSIATGGVSVKEQKRCLKREIKCEIIQESKKKTKGKKAEGKKGKKSKKGRKKKRRTKRKSNRGCKKAQRSKQKGVSK